MPHSLTHDEIIFRVLLHRDEQRDKVTYAALEKALPKDLRKRIEPDWRAFIRDESIEFDSAFQKAIRKHLPGIYYVIVAAEFLFKVPFHSALSHYLLVSNAGSTPNQLESEEVFALAEELAAEVRRRQAEATTERQQSAPPTPPSAKPPHKPSEPTHASPALRSVPKRDEKPNRAPIVPVHRPSAPTKHATANAVTPNWPATRRRCAFCRQWFSPSEIVAHVDKHINPPGKGPTNVVILHHTCGIPQGPEVHPVIPRNPRFARFNSGRCISCGNVPIPGDFYCYYCAPK
jgi:hypothetical protein